MTGKIENAELCRKEEIARVLNPLVRGWFFSRFKDFSLPQLYGVMPIYSRKNILISAPTGGTKTLTAFLSILNYLVELALKNELEDKIYAVYASPLKALSNDIYVNLIQPLEEIEEIAKSQGKKMQKIRVGLRTGDTTVSERQKMAKNVPHILVTTPESLSIILLTKKFVEKMNAVEFLIVDEIHALANKRGVHLSLSLELLEEISAISPVRIGLSATISPIEEIAKFLIGFKEERKCLIADIKFDKKLDIEVITPVGKLMETTGIEMHSSLYGLIDRLIQEHKTTLIFTNTRSATERVIHHLKEMFPSRYLEDAHKSKISGSSKTESFEGIGAHHSSLSKEHRFNIEQRLREGKLKVVVTSTSLELGIDIGYVDLVILLGSPKSVARAIQRIGRAGHKLHETAKGRFVVLDRDDLVECSVMEKEIKEHRVDKIQIPRNCLDVLSQQIYGMAIYKIWNMKKMFEIIKRSYCYHELSYEDFSSVISYLAGEYALEHRNVYAKIWYDVETGEIGKRGKLARVIYMTNIGTIPDESFVTVVLGRGDGKGNNVGKIDEGFLERLKPGDVFVLGGNRYQFLYSRGMKAYVLGSVNRPPTIPAWFSEMLPLSFDLALEISRFRSFVEERFKSGKSPEEIKEFIKEYCYASTDVAEEIFDYFDKQYRYIGIPGNRKIIIENYNGEKNYFIFHSLFGRRVNDALSRAIAYLAGQQVGRDVEVGINDNGFYIIGEKISRERIEKVLKFLNSGNVREVLDEAVGRSEILQRRFRHCATRALMILRSYKGRSKSVGKQQVSSFLLHSAVKKISKDFPILREARREVLEDVMDIDNAKKVLEWLDEGRIKIEFKETNVPSPFSLNLIMQARYDLIKMEDKIEFLKRMHEEIGRRVG